MNEVARGWKTPDGRHRAGLRRFGAWRFVAAWVGREVAILDPGCFALVMATGIVSNAFFLQGQHALADALFAVNLAAFPLLWLLTAWRVARFGASLWADLVSPRRVFLFFTAVAATDVLGMSIAMRGFTTIALAMWLFALALWFVLIYLGFGVLMLRNTVDGADVVEGAWLNAIVGTQSLAILGAFAALPAAHAGPQLFMLLHMLWTLGLILYGIFVALLSYRIFFAALKPDDVTPPLWVVMGAAAISVNAGAILIVRGGTTPFLHSLQPFLDGVTLATWAWATWWIPLLLLLGIWKHGHNRIPIRYTPMLWSMVFPLGMYAVATLRLSRLADVPVLGSWSWAVAWLALAAWAATALGLGVATFRKARAFVVLAQRFGAHAAMR
jgi:tellurite resistance protein TehA-like permease